MSETQPEGRRKRSPIFDPTFNWGHIFIAITMGASVFFAWADVKSDQRVADTRMVALEATSRTMGEAITKLASKAEVDARQDEQIRGLDRRVTAVEGRVDRLENKGR